MSPPGSDPLRTVSDGRAQRTELRRDPHIYEIFRDVSTSLAFM
jgi:hypothetical protein